MPIICIGPVCIPITAIIPILLFVFKPIYVRLPTKYQKKIDYGIKQCQLAMNRCLKKIGWTKSKKKSSPSPKNESDDIMNTNQNQSTTIDRPSDEEVIKEMEDDRDWNALIQQSSSSNLMFMAYFTSPWCKPCKQFYPVFEDLANKSQR
eukprot:210319_1